jgi:hypothetical protein
MKSVVTHPVVENVWTTLPDLPVFDRRGPHFTEYLSDGNPLARLIIPMYHGTLRVRIGWE